MDQWCAAHGYEITAQLRERGFSEKGPPRKVDSLNGRGRAQLEEFWTTWGFLSERIEELQEGERWTWLQSGSSHLGV